MHTNCRIKFEQFQTDERDPLSWPSSKLVPDKSFAEIMNRLALDIRKNAELQKYFIINLYSNNEVNKNNHSLLLFLSYLILIFHFNFHGLVILIKREMRNIQY